jgi:hypothetical protein
MTRRTATLRSSGTLCISPENSFEFAPDIGAEV